MEAANTANVQDQPMGSNEPYSKMLRQKIQDSKKGGNLNYTEKRILKDLEEFEFNVNPDMGISARPLEDTIYKWHANIKGLADSPYEGGIFHFEITIPGDYPNKPPVIETVTPMTNNFFISGKYRSEMVEDDWCSGYSLFSLLLQIQFGFFDFQESQSANIKQEVAASKTFKCKDCAHDGENNIYPPFESALENGPVNYASKTEEEKLIEDTYCFHTRMNVQETTQGTGVAFSRQMRTTEVSRIYTTIDLVSQKAFKEGLRKSVNKKRFSHWLPLYFKDTCDTEKTVDLFRKHLSEIATGSKDKFDEKMILQIMPKLMLTHIVQLLNDKAYSSIKGIRMLNYFHRAFLFMLEQHPQVQFELEKTIEKFIHDEEARSRENHPDLGMILAIITVSKKFRFEQIVSPFFYEKLSRNVFYLIKEIPEYENITDNAFNQEFIQKVFKTNESSWKLTMFMAYYNNFIVDKNHNKRDLSKVIEEYDKRYSRLYYKIEEEIQKEVDLIKVVANFNDFFNKVGIETKSNNELKEMMINSVVKSKEKGYHGGLNVLYPLPEIKEQAKEVMKDKVTILSFYNPFDEDSKMMDDEEDFVKYVRQRFTWTNNYFLEHDKVITPEFLAVESDLRNSCNTHDLNIQSAFRNSFVDGFQHSLKSASPNRPYKDYSWRQLFMKLDFEEFIYLNEYAQDKEALKTYLEVCAKETKGLVLKQPSRKSDDISYSFYTDIIEACAPYLTKLVLVGTTDNSDIKKKAFPITQGFITCIRMGFKTAEHIDLRQLEIHYVNHRDNFGTPVPIDTYEQIGLEELLNIVPFIDTLRMSNFGMSKVSIKCIFDAVKPDRFKEISMVNCGIEKYAAKELMTHLKSAEALEVLNLSHNKIENGVKSIFDSLKGRKNLRVFDISYNLLTHVQDVKSSFSAFISETSSLEHLNFTYTNIHQNLDEKSLKTLGNLPRLAGISFESSTCKMDQVKLKAVGQALVDAKNKEAPVDYVILRGCFNTYPDYEEFFEVVSQLSPLKEAEQLDGFELIDDPMGNEAKAVFKYMDISLGTFESGFDQSKLKRGEYPGLKYLFTLVQSLNMDSCKMNEKDARMIRYCLNRAGTKSALKSLTLSHNPLGAAGAKALANLEVSELDLSNCKVGVGGACALGKALKTNSCLKKLNLYNNGLKVEGARYLAQGLEETKTLEYLDVGSNTIRDKGFEALKSCLESSITFLAAKNNQIRDKAFNQFMESYHASGNSTLKTLMLASNDISMYTIKLTEEDIEGRMYIDLKLKLENNNERVLFLCGIHPENTKTLLKKYFDSKSCGIIENIDIIRGREKKKGKQNIFGFVKFAHKNGKMRVIGNLKEFEENAIKI